MMTISRPVWGLLAVIFLGISACDGDALSGVKDLDGRYADPTSDSAARATVTLFVDNDCPVSNRYAPEVQRLYRQYAALGVKFWLVYPDPRISVATIREHMREYGYEIPALRDPEHALVRRANALVTPEAGIFLADGTLVYHGRIDNRYVDLTRRRPDATQHDVADVLDAVLAGKAVDASWSPAPGRSLKAMSQPGVGCYIGDFK
jgi:hypothetical protein